MKKKITVFIIAALLLSFLVADIYSQNSQIIQDISDQELLLFIKTVEEIQIIQENGFTSIENAIEESGLSEELFFEIYETAQEDPKATEKFAAEERDAFTSAIYKITVIQESMQADLVDTVETSGIAVNRFNAIMARLQNDPVLQNRVRAIVN